MKTILYCDSENCLRSPKCWPRKYADTWTKDFWVAIDIATRRARTARRPHQVRRGNVGYGVGWIVQEIR